MLRCNDVGGRGNGGLCVTAGPLSEVSDDEEELEELDDDAEDEEEEDAAELELLLESDELDEGAGLGIFAV